MDCDFINEEYMQQVYKNIALLLKNERKRQNITVSMLEKCSGIDKTAIYKMENNKRRFGLENLIRMCYVLNLKLDDLYYINDNNKYRTEVRKLLKNLSEDKCADVYQYILKINDDKKGVGDIESKIKT